MTPIGILNRAVLGCLISLVFANLRVELLTVLVPRLPGQAATVSGHSNDDLVGIDV